MYRLLGRRCTVRALGALTALSVLAVGLRGGLAQPAVEEVGHVRLLPEMQTLIQARIPVGVVLGEAESFETVVPLRTEGVQPDVPDRAALLSRLGKRWGDVFTVSDTGTTVTVSSPRAHHCRAGLTRLIKADTFDGTPLEVLFALSASFDADLKRLPPPGLVSGGGRPDSSPSDALTRSVHLVVEEGTLQSALNGLAAAAGAGWFAADRCDGITGRCQCQLGLLTSTSVVHSGYDAAVGLDRGR
jgi:hypothetical protein